MDFLEPLQTVWDYLGMHQAPEKADVIVGFGNFNTNIARRAAELYLQGLAPVVLFTGGLGRNTEGLLPEPEAVRFARVAMECGVPEMAILMEPDSTNTAENILFTRRMLEEKGSAPVSNSVRLADLIRRPEIGYDDIAPFDPQRPALPKAVTEEVEIQLKYAGYLLRQEKQVEEFRKEESRLLPEDLDYNAIGGLRLEARQKLAEIRPMSIGQAGRISGVSPADIAVLLIYLETNGQKKQPAGTSQM